MGHVPPHSSTPAPHPRSRGGGRIDVRPTNLATRPLRLPAQARSNERGANGLLDNSVIPLVSTLRMGTCLPSLCGACRADANNSRRAFRCASGSSRSRREASKTVFPRSERSQERRPAVWCEVPRLQVGGVGVVFQEMTEYGSVGMAQRQAGVILLDHWGQG